MTSTSAPALLGTLETYYDTVPRAGATAEEVGPFTLFVKTDRDGFDYYARPRLGLDREPTADDVRRARKVLHARGVPEAFEWVHETTPSLTAAAREAGLAVHECPLLVLGAGALPAQPPTDARVVVLAPEAPEVEEVLGAVHAGFGGTDAATPRPGARARRLMAAGLMAHVGAFDAEGRAVGGGSHAPRDGTSELAGIAVLPRARRRGVGAAVTAALTADAVGRGVSTVFLSAQDDTVARVYERIGFRRVGTACVAEPVT